MVDRMLSTLGIVAASICWASLPIAYAYRPAAHSSVRFLSESVTARNFYSAILVVHGWNGGCESTFGEQEESLYSVLGNRKFYDWDCFQYDSRFKDIRSNARDLQSRLRQIKALGYQKLMIITHSTGGILILRALSNEFGATGGPQGSLQHISIPEGIPVITQINAWATPINGLRAHIDALVGIASAIFSPETLMDLKSDAPFLQQLKTDLAAMFGYLSHLPPQQQGRWPTRIVFYQGQGKDWWVEISQRRKVKKKVGIGRFVAAS
jgi:pimeloyl-ACP methyl ester carboxylesterase